MNDLAPVISLDTFRETGKIKPVLEIVPPSQEVELWSKARENRLLLIARMAIASGATNIMHYLEPFAAARTPVVSYETADITAAASEVQPNLRLLITTEN